MALGDFNEERIELWLSRYGRWIGIRPEELGRSRKWFSRYGLRWCFGDGLSLVFAP